MTSLLSRRECLAGLGALAVSELLGVCTRDLCQIDLHGDTLAGAVFDFKVGRRGGPRN